MVAVPPVVVDVPGPLAVAHRLVPAPPVVADVAAPTAPTVLRKAPAPPVVCHLQLTVVSPQSERVLALLAPVRIPV